jgi:SAM-dependent methyltransferase
MTHDFGAGQLPTTGAEWDERYASSPQLFSGSPNSVLMRETAGLAPGRVLEVGCGEGADAIWLARQGWDVTALDVSAVALDRAARSAEQAAVQIRWVHAGLADAALPLGNFDLVSAHYPALPSSADRRAERVLVSAVAPAGLLLAVYHAGLDGQWARAHGIDPRDYVQVTDIVAALLEGDWNVELETSRPRATPLGASEHKHTDDVVLLARRLS